MTYPLRLDLRGKIRPVLGPFVLFLNQAVILFSLPLVSCATKTITFNVAGEPDSARVSLVSFDNFDEDGENLGVAPVTVPLKDLEGRVVKFSQPGKQNLYWAFTNASGNQSEALVRLPNITESNESAAGDKTATNKMMRLVLESYKALSGGRFRVAHDLAAQASTIYPQLAAPYIVQGIALRQLGEVDAARAALIKAKSLDPNDQNIDRLMESLGIGAID